MYCEECGAEIKEGETFCTKCGTKVNPPSEAPKADPVPEEPKAEQAPEAPKTDPVPEAPKADPVPEVPKAEQGKEVKEKSKQSKKKKEKIKKEKVKKGNKKLVFLLGGAALIALAIGIIVFLLPKRESIKAIKVNLNDYIEVSFEGYDEIGTAQAKFNTEEFLKNYNDQIAYVDKDKVRQVMNQLYSTPIQALYAELHGDLNNVDHLKNQQKITYHWNIDKNKIEKYFNCELVYSDQEFIVEGLKQLEEVDPFEGVTVVVSGYNGYGVMDVEHNNEILHDTSLYYNYDWSGKEIYKNGDVVTVSIEGMDEESIKTFFIENQHKKLTRLSKDYTIEGLPVVITDMSQITETALNDMKKYVEDDIKNMDYNEHRILKEIEYLGYSFGVYNEQFSTDRTPNFLNLVFKVTEAYEYPEQGFSESFSYYYIQSLSELIADETGNYSKFDDNDCTSTDAYFNHGVVYGNELFEQEEYGYNGYETLEQYYNAEVNNFYISYSYDIETNIIEK